MSSIKAFFTSHGILVGEAREGLTGSWVIKNPAVLLNAGNQVALVPFLAMFEENEVVLEQSDINFGKPFTPQVDIRNHYNTLFGNGIVEAKTLHNVIKRN